MNFGILPKNLNDLNHLIKINKIHIAKNIFHNKMYPQLEGIEKYQRKIYEKLVVRFKL